MGLGYRYLETDLQATADGVLVAFHDKTLTRVCGQVGQVRRLTRAELSAARIDGTEPIPRLEDLLGAWPDVRFNLDVKDAAAIAPLPEVLRRTNAWDRVCVVSFSASRAAGHLAVPSADPRSAWPRSPLGTAAVRFGGPGSRATVHGPRATRPRPRRSPGQQGQWPLHRSVLARSGVRCVQVPVSMATPSFISRAQALGLQVHAWTVNDQPSMQRLLDLGVDGIMTDETVALRELLTARGQWHPRLPAES